MHTRDQFSSFLHTPSWQNVKHAKRDAFDNVYQNVPLFGGQYYLSTRAFIPKDWTLPNKASSYIFARIQPDSPESASALKSHFSGTPLKLTGSIQPKQTSIIDLTKSEEVILHAMRSKHRYNIKLAQRHNVTCVRYSKNLEAHLDRFWVLLHATSKRHEFRTHTFAHYQAIATEHTNHEVELWFATRDGRDLAAAMIIRHDNVVTYLHGGSDHTKRKYMAPYLLHFEIMCAHKNAGATHYDLWGVNTVNGAPIPHHPSEGTTKFKLGFGGTLIEYPPTYDVVFHLPKYMLYRILSSLKNRRRAFS